MGSFATQRWRLAAEPRGSLRPAWSAAAGLLALLLGVAAVSAEAQIAVEGRILADEGGTIPRGVTATLIPLLSRSREKPESGELAAPAAPVARSSLDAEGRFHLLAPRPGMWCVELRAPGRLALAHDLVPLLRAARLPPVFLPHARPRAVEVLDESGRAVAGARVSLLEVGTKLGEEGPFPDGWHPATRRGRSGRRGMARLPVAPGEALALHAELGDQPRSGLRVLGLEDWASDTQWTITLRRRPARSVAKPEPLVGRILTTDGGRPLPGAFVWPAHDPSAAVRSGENGEFRLPGGRGAVWLRAASAGHLPEALLVTGDSSPPHLLRLEPARALAGRVLDSEGRPVEGAQLALDRPARLLRSPPAVSGADGGFLLEAPRPGEAVAILADGFAPRRLPLPAGDTEFLVLLDREPWLTGAAVADDGRPLPGARVLLELLGGNAAGSSTVVAGLDGRFAFGGLQPGSYRLTLRRAGYLPAALAPVRLPAEPGRLSVGAVALAAGVSLAGRAVDARAAPVGGARVAVEPYGPCPAWPEGSGKRVVAITGPDGTFGLDGLPGGCRVDLAVTLRGRVPAEVKGVVLPPPEPIRVVIEDGARLAGRVLTAEGRPTEGAQVEAWRDDPPALLVWTVSDEEGRFQLAGLGPGRVSLSARADGLAPVRLRGLEVLEGGEMEGLELILPAGLALSGRVLGAGGRPLEQASVSVGAAGYPASPSSKARTLTDAEGRFRLDGLEAGELWVRAEHVDYPPLDHRLDLEESRARLELEMSEGASVSGRVVDAGGQALSGAEVQLRAEGAGVRETRSRGDGSFELTVIPAGEWWLDARAPGRAPAGLPEPLRLRAGQQVAAIELRLGPGGVLSGRILGASPEELRGATVQATDGTTGADSAVDGAGVYRLEELGPGEWQVAASVADGRTASAQIVLAAGEEERHLDLSLEGGHRVGGRVLVDGAPASGLQVRLVPAKPPGPPAVRTDPGGYFERQGVLAGSYRIELSDAARGLFHSREVTVGGDLYLEIELPLARLSGQVLGGGGEPIGQADVVLLPADAGESLLRRAITGADGRFSFAGLTAGRWRVAASSSGHGSAETGVEIVPDRPAVEVKLVLDSSPGF